MIDVTATISYEKWLRTLAFITKKLSITNGGIAKSIGVVAKSRFVINNDDNDR